MSHPRRTEEQDALQSLLDEREDVLRRIRQKKSAIRTSALSLFQPSRPASRYGRLLSHVNQALTVYDGVMFGIKMVRSLRRSLRR